ncbi:MAG: lipoyl(octanoyl) transferase LipB [Eubacteriales bacterium]
MCGNCQVLLLGLKDYLEALSFQERIRQFRIRDEAPDTLLLLEHPPVFTIGRKGGKGDIICTPERLGQEGIKVYEVNRGGGITYHGPGQLVGYPVFDLNLHGRDVHKYVRLLEEVIIRTIGEFGIEGGRVEGLTGVWVGNEKIAAIGIAVKNWVTMHGFALNVDPDLNHFGLINPCGITNRGVTSMRKVLRRAVRREEVTDALIENIGTVFKVKITT